MPVSIGVLSSIPCDEFKNTLQDVINVNITGQNAFTYKDDRNTVALLQQAVQEFNAGNPVAVTWIITLGGRIAYDSIVDVAAANAIPFVSLLGAAPANRPNLCHGGVSLESYGYNKYRVDYLVNQRGFDSGSISLYYSQYSHLAQAELDDWNNVLPISFPGLGPAVPAFTSAAPNAADYAHTVGNIPTQNVVISADPFFHKTKNRLVGPLNGTNKYVVYPFHNYENARPAPTHNFATVYGPTLDSAIKVLGVIAAIVINNHTTIDFLKDPIGIFKDL